MPLYQATAPLHSADSIVKPVWLPEPPATWDGSKWSSYRHVDTGDIRIYHHDRAVIVPGKLEA